jgi:NAD-dependent deacetylase
MNTSLEEAAKAIRSAKSVIAVTGAGVSVESGIPDFRSAGGLWTKYPPEEFATLDAFERDPSRLWKLWLELGEMLQGVQPNPAHFALAELEKLGWLHGIITQNIDNLHQIAGNTKVIEYHGNAQRLHCLACHKRTPLKLEELGGKAPVCTCGAVMKPDVVLFGEMIPKHALFESEALAQNADVVIIVGTSATVYPAAGLPFTAKQHGAYIIECNLDSTDFTARITDTFLQGTAGTTLPELLKQVQS